MFFALLGANIRLNIGWMQKRMPARSIAILTFCVCAAFAAAAQDMMRYVDLNSPEMTTAEMTRDEVAAKAAAATPGHPADFTG